jgi:uncharacterized BrkB/YihY/UPF0761 family membrane protein
VVARARDGLNAKRQSSTTVSVAYDTFGQDVEAGGPVLAAALGFRVVLFLVPYVCVVLLIGGYVADAFDRTPDQLVHGRGIARITAKAITSGQGLSNGVRITAIVLIAYALFLGARSFLKVLLIVHTLVWRVAPSRMRRPTYATVIFIGLVSVAIGLSVLVDALLPRVVIGGIAALALYSLVGFAIWWAVSWWLPHGDCDPLGLVPGAVVFALGLEALQVVTIVWFPRSMASKSELYGTIGAALVLLLWSYLLGRLMAVAAALNVALWRRRKRHPLPPPRFISRLPLVADRLGHVWTRLTTHPGDDHTQSDRATPAEPTLRDQRSL